MLALPTLACDGSPGMISLSARNASSRVSIADFFRRNEPHSPIPFALEQAVRWGQMPLPQLLRELIPDDGSRQNFFKLTGIPDERKLFSVVR